ncbi:hypothetical protein HMPREF0649_01618 [Segatella buccae D17]|nr:hypothetical protein HMPREF0649_01618 [Segatella buccae D17]
MTAEYPRPLYTFHHGRYHIAWCLPLFNWCHRHFLDYFLNRSFSPTFPTYRSSSAFFFLSLQGF